MREVRTARWRRGLLAVAGAAAAAILAAVLTVVATRPSPTPPAAAGRPMHAVVATPVQAKVALTAEKWGTRITLHCRYVAPNGSAFVYKMVAIDRDGDQYSLGGWSISGGQEITYEAGAPVPPRQIAKVLVTTRNGTPILQLVT